MPDCALILLAAGNSSRMGKPKQLLPFHGKPLVCHAVEVALAAGCSPVIVVLGANDAAVASALAGLPVRTTVNQNWAAGMGGSIRAGLRELESGAASDHPPECAILALADQPFITADFYRKLVEEHARTGANIVAARYSETVGVPVLFSREAWPLLHALPAEQGCKGVILKNQRDSILLDCPEAAWDIDTPADYVRALGEG